MSSDRQNPSTSSEPVTPTLDPGVIPALGDGQEIVVLTEDGDRVEAVVKNQEVIASGGQIVDPGSVQKVGIVGEGPVIQHLPTQETDIRPDTIPREWPDAPDTFTTLAPVALRRMVATRTETGINLDEAARTAAAKTIDRWYHDSIEAEMVDILTDWLRDYHPGEIIDSSEVPDRWEALTPLSTDEEVPGINSSPDKE